MLGGLRAAQLALRVRGLRDGLLVHGPPRLARRAPHACPLGLADPRSRAPGVSTRPYSWPSASVPAEPLTKIQ